MKISIIGGGGRVGLPLAITLANFGHTVTIIDKNEERVQKINDRIMPFREKDADLILSNLQFNALRAVTNIDAILGSEICILIVGTPVNTNGTPSAGELVDLASELIEFLPATKLLMLRSTVYPGITDQISELFSKKGLKTLVSYCPERIAEGVALDEIKNLPQVIGATTDEAYELSKEVFSGISPKFIRTTTEEAEISKLFTNTYRYFKFAIANEFFKLCIEKKINWENVWYSIKEDYPRAIDLPKPGFAAGPCLVKDTQQLNYYNGGKLSLAGLALEINEGLPDFIVSILCNNFRLDKMVVGILGMTFKSNVDDFRSSLSFRLKMVLEKVAKEVVCSDELIQKDYFINSKELIARSDIIIIASAHQAYSELLIDKPLVDIWRINPTPSII